MKVSLARHGGMAAAINLRLPPLVVDFGRPAEARGGRVDLVGGRCKGGTGRY